MAGKTGPNDPGGRRPRDKVRELQRRLWAAAKQASGRRFHALYNHVWRCDVLQEAWKRVKANRGAAGIDGQSIRDVEEQGVERFLEELGAELKAGTYRPPVVKRRYIPKADGKQRPLGIPTVRDRVAQIAVKLVMEPVFEADFLPCSYGFRPKRSTTMALETLRKLKCFVQLDDYVLRRLRSLRRKRKGRNLRAGEFRAWTREYFENLGLHRLRGTVRYPEQPFWKQEAA